MTPGMRGFPWQRFATVVPALALLSAWGATPVVAAEFSVAGGVGTVWTDNVFVRNRPEWDLSVNPALRADVDFATFWTLRYEGAAEIFTRHTDLTSHDHALRLVVNPAFGADERHEFLVAVDVETLRNLDTYRSLNFVGGGLTASLSLEPSHWFAWMVSATVRYRAFYDDPQADALDVFAATQARFTLPSRTTLTPRIGYGYRYNAGLRDDGSGAVDRDDHQLDAGLHLSQALWRRAGLQAGYHYRHLFSTSRELTRKLTQTQFAFLTADFLSGGHRTYLRFKQLLPEGFHFLAGVEYRDVRFPGWPAADAAGALIGEDRRDHRLLPSAQLAWARGVGALGLEVNVAYAFLRQWSNAAEYDASAHQVTVGIALDY